LLLQAAGFNLEGMYTFMAGLGYDVYCGDELIVRATVSLLRGCL
jgi:hypothetical protein